VADEGGVRELAELRRRVDRVNRDLLQLLEERAELVLAIAEVKQQLEIEAFDPRREEEMLRSLIRQARGPFGPAELRHIFGAIFRASLDLMDRSGYPARRRTRGRSAR
jgi:3-deoxy-7-phosphoheptulonate synthase/chorismate mutase